MVIAPVLAAPVLAATEKAATPLPVPLAPEVRLTQLRLLDAFQAQEGAEAVTATPLDPPPASKLRLAGLMVKVQVWAPDALDALVDAPVFAPAGGGNGVSQSSNPMNVKLNRQQMKSRKVWLFRFIAAYLPEE